MRAERAVGQIAQRQQASVGAGIEKLHSHGTPSSSGSGRCAGSGRKRTPGPAQAAWTIAKEETLGFLAHDRDARRLEQAGAGKSKSESMCAQAIHGSNVASGRPEVEARDGRHAKNVDWRRTSPQYQRR